ncbi:hypothetical protein MNBD_PLANCTO02-1130 [hydrothermal vent metagenome]|uniref:BioF2-like acetyltransferase domain-containing protein n=1 Tax=hydrothermal vent metagenome TaxID=652676 RepID=A0A3B1E5Y2_9ZZZZ
MKKQEPCTYHLCHAQNLKEEDWLLWLQIQKSRSDLESPFFHPGLTRSVANIRNDVEIVVLKHAGETVGYFPFQRCSGRVAQSVVGRLSEFHGVISKPSISFQPEEILRAAGLRSWHFDHLPVSQHQFENHTWGKSDSPYMDISEGYATYRDVVKKKGSSLSQVERKSRKMGREVGELKFEFHSNNASAFQSLIEWKSEQHQRTGVLQVMKVEWVTALLDLLRQTEFHGFKGQFSTLHAGDNLVAVHLGLRNESILHIWFPAYNVQFEKYSPGLVLLLEMAKQSAEEKLKRVDLGRGEERYKINFKTDNLQIAEGIVDTRPLSPQLRKGWFNIKRWIRTSPYRKQLEIPLKASRKLRQWNAFQ